MGHVYAALDLGTNNCRLLVARPTAGGFQVVDAFSRIVRLGEGLGTTGLLSEAAMQRSIEALGLCVEKMHRRGVDRARSVATEACRRAANGGDFLERVSRQTGLELDVIGAAEEAQLALAGCASLLDPAHRHGVVFDIGGGSTELLWVGIAGDGRPLTHGWTSLPLGVVTLAERWGGGEVSVETYRGMVQEVLALLAPFDAAHSISGAVAAGPVQMLGTSGTVTTLAAVSLDLPRYERARVDGAWLGFDEIRRVSSRLAAMGYGARAAHPCIGSERADLVLAGCAILEAIGGLWPVPRLRVADRGVREGVLQQLMAQAERDAQPRAAADEARSA